MMANRIKKSSEERSYKYEEQRQYNLLQCNSLKKWREILFFVRDGQMLKAACIFLIVVGLKKE